MPSMDTIGLDKLKAMKDATERAIAQRPPPIGNQDHMNTLAYVGLMFIDALCDMLIAEHEQQATKERE